MKKQLSRVGIGMFCYISTVLLFSTPKFTNISIKKNEKIGALGLNFILSHTSSLWTRKSPLDDVGVRP
jgi:hypothetical protein